MIIKNQIHFLIGVFSCITFALGQEPSFTPPDSLKNKEYDYIFEEYKKVKNDTAKVLIYLKTYLEKGKGNKDKIKIARAYCLISRYETEDVKKIAYLDSSITISKNENNKYFPALPYCLKGNFYFDKWNYESALNNYILTLKYAEKKKNEELISAATHNIALIKYGIGKYDEALGMFKKSLLYEEQRDNKVIQEYLESIVSIAYTYCKLEQIDSSLHYGRKGMLLAQQKGYPAYYNKFLLNEGINLYYKKEYTSAIDSITKSLPSIEILEDKSYLIDAYFYLGKVSKALKKTEETHSFYKKIDSVFKSTERYVSSEVRESYESLINHYKAKQDLRNQLVYIERLLEFDSILNANNKFLSNKIIKEYDTFELMKVKQNLIDDLNTRNKRRTNIIIILTIAISVISSLFYYQYKKRKTYKKRFNDIIKNNRENQTSSSLKITDLESKTRESLDAPDEITEKILSRLEKLENNLEFLDPNIYINDIAIQCSTNQRYVSNVINAYKKRNFNRYLNDLRIEYAIDKLQNDRRFLLYSIEAIAKEVGFNNKGTFANSFKKNKGLTPVYFINQLKEERKRLST